MYSRPYKIHPEGALTLSKLLQRGGVNCSVSGKHSLTLRGIIYIIPRTYKGIPYTALAPVKHESVPKDQRP